MKNSLIKRYTKGQLRLQEIIEKEIGLQTILEYNVDKYFLDIFLPELHDRAIEFDGPFHSKNKDKKRDEKILETHGIKILRIKDLKDPDLILKIKEFVDN